MNPSRIRERGHLSVRATGLIIFHTPGNRLGKIIGSGPVGQIKRKPVCLYGLREPPCGGVRCGQRVQNRGILEPSLLTGHLGQANRFLCVMHGRVLAYGQMPGQIIDRFCPQLPRIDLPNGPERD